MSILLRTLVLTALLATTSMAAAAEPAPGQYASQPGFGTLDITRDATGTLRFAINAVSADAAVCDLQGTVSNGVGTTDADGDAPPCRISLRAQGGRIELSPQTQTECRQYCGLNAGFEGTYARLPPGCDVRGREARNRTFLADYRGKRYAKALATLEKTHAQCGAFFDWLERDQFANDKALTLHHLGRNAQCLDALRTTEAFGKDERTLDVGGGAFARSLYLPVAKATWHNTRLCQAGHAKAPRR